MIDTTHAIPADTLLCALFDFYAGNKARLARDLGVSRGTLDQWECIPEKYALQIEELTGGTLTLRDMCLSALAHRHPSTS